MPAEGETLELCELLYAASLLKEEGRPVRARIIVAPPEAFSSAQASPGAVHVVRFTTPHALTANEIKRLSPAASFFHSVIAVWPDKTRGFGIWGILNTGPRWMNQVAGGRKSAGSEIPHPIIHVRDPGWLLFYQDYLLFAEWRGREFHGPRMDVFQSRMMNERFIELRRRIVAEMGARCLPASLSTDTYTELVHMIALQFLRRVINLVRTSGHGGSLVMIPPPKDGHSVADRWVDCKYTAAPDLAGNRVKTLIQAILCRIGQLSPDGTSLEEAWQVFRNSTDAELDHLEEAFFELARLYSDMMQVDGALVLEHGLNIIGFGGEIRVDRNVIYVEQAHDLDGGSVSRWNVQSDGTRHRSIYRLCAVEPEVVGFVISQDSQVRMIANMYDSVIFWAHSAV